MKLSTLCVALGLAALFFVGTKPSLEAKHHNRFSFNVGTFFPAYSPGYVVRSYPPRYVEQHVYMDPYGYPVRESVYVYPQYYQQVYVPPAPVFSGFSFGMRFR